MSDIMTAQSVKTHRPLKWVAGMAAALVLLAGVGGGVQLYQTQYAVDAVVSLDVNPSIEIQTNKKERVLAVHALNEDGAVVVGTMDFRGSDLEVAVNALIGSMLRNGYLSEAANSILVSVDGKNSVRTQTLQEKLTDDIQAMLETAAFSGAVLSQTVSADTELQALADASGITLGKAQLIQQLVSQNPQYAFEELAGLTINELNLLSQSHDIQLENIQSAGTASASKYIGADRARTIALTHAGKTEAEVSRWELELEYKHETMIYEVEFVCGSTQYEYEIDAVTGDILENKQELDEESDKDKDSDDDKDDKDDDEDNQDTAGTVYIDEAQAKATALTQAGCSADVLLSYTCDLYTGNNPPVYKVKFRTADATYSCDVHAVTGLVVKYEREAVGSSYRESSTTTVPVSRTTVSSTSAATGNQTETTTTHTKPTTTTAAYIGEAQAKALALAHAAVNEEDIAFYKWKLDTKGSLPVYELEFLANGYEYSYAIQAVTGEILKYDRDKD